MVPIVDFVFVLFFICYFKCVVFKIFVFMLRQSDMEIMGFRHGLLRLHVLLLTTGLHWLDNACIDRYFKYWFFKVLYCICWDRYSYRNYFLARCRVILTLTASIQYWYYLLGVGFLRSAWFLPRSSQGYSPVKVSRSFFPVFCVAILPMTYFVSIICAVFKISYFICTLWQSDMEEARFKRGNCGGVLYVKCLIDHLPVLAK